ncbi:hypothetical protein VTJ49DRAFT_5385 [Mycothermus thermophilus]|uniref:Uncharacterized protein n=1 Tax=Humicola insolens TaxID=85995 RepID=A0ABR3V3A5_HUMIN
MKSAVAFTLALSVSLAHAGINWDVYEYGVVPTFRWSRPFPDDGSEPMGFHIKCRNTASFKAKMYKLKDLAEEPPTGLAPWKEGIERFMAQRDYAGSWDGVDHKDQDREIIVMEWTDVPESVRQWIEQQQRGDGLVPEHKWLFGVFRKPKEEGEKIYNTVRPKPLPKPTPIPGSEQEHGQQQSHTDSQTQQAQQQQEQKTESQAEAAKSPSAEEEEPVPDIPDTEKIVVFPAGAIYENLPLWAAKGSNCERQLHDLSKYKSQAIDHAVLAWPIDHTKPLRDWGKRDITFKVEAMEVEETDDQKKSRQMWERMHRMIKRNDRRQQREERQRARREMEEVKYRVRDEL